jgi:hypothetical protein
VGDLGVKGGAGGAQGGEAGGSITDKQRARLVVRV